MFSCEFYEIPKNTFSTEHLQTTVSNPWRVKTTLQGIFSEYNIPNKHLPVQSKQ